MKRAPKEYAGINIQQPFAELILSGDKTIETRTYPIPGHYLKQDMVLIETPGTSGKFSARMRGIIRFTDCFKYSSKAAFYNDLERHLVTPNSPWAWTKSGKWGWAVEVVSVFKKPLPLQKRTGIKYSTGILLNRSAPSKAT